MIAAVVALAVLAAAALAALAWLVLRTPDWLGTRWPRLDRTAAAAFDSAPGPPVVAGTTRRLISIEILNAGDLAGSRGRLAGIAHTIVPGLTRRIVYDQTVRILRDQLAAQQVEADVRVHVIRPAGSGADPPSARVIDEVSRIELDEPPTGQSPV